MEPSVPDENAVAAPDTPPPLHVVLFSFGFKYGLPQDSNYVWDVRFLPNPYWVQSMRHRTGQEKDVAGYALGNPAGEQFLRLLKPLLLFTVEQFRLAGKTELRLGVGCTGGRHRSVAVVEFLQAMLATQPVVLTVFHRDIDKG